MHGASARAEYHAWNVLKERSSKGQGAMTRRRMSIIAAVLAASRDPISRRSFRRHPAGETKHRLSIAYGIRRTQRHRQFRSRAALSLRQTLLQIVKHVRSVRRAMIMSWMVTLLVATVPTDQDHSGLLQTDVGQVNGPSRRSQTA
jgi:hypothetical protein